MLKKLVAAVVSMAVLFVTVVSSEASTDMNNSIASKQMVSYRNNERMYLNAFENAEVKVASVSAGSRYSGAVTEDGNLYMWGWNGSGQLGDGAETGIYLRSPVSEPVKVLENVESVSLSQDHSGAVTRDGNLYMWGIIRMDN